MGTVLVVLFLFILQPSILVKSKMECPNGQKSYKSLQIRQRRKERFERLMISF